MNQEEYDFFREKARFVFEDDVPHFIRVQTIEKIADDEELSEKINKLIKDKINYYLGIDTYVKQYYEGYKSMPKELQAAVEYLEGDDAKWKVFDHIKFGNRHGEISTRSIMPDRVELKNQDGDNILDIMFKTGEGRYFHVFIYSDANEVDISDSEPGYRVENSNGDLMLEYFTEGPDDFREFYLNLNDQERDIYFDCGFSGNDDYKQNIHHYLNMAKG